MQIQKTQNIYQTPSFGTKLTFNNYDELTIYGDKLLNSITKTFERKTNHKDTFLKVNLSRDKSKKYQVWEMKYQNGEHKDKICTFIEDIKIPQSYSELLEKLNSFLNVFETREKELKKIKKVYENLIRLKDNFTPNTQKEIDKITNSNTVSYTPEWYQLI